jgi:hypothetical protein
MIDLSKLGALKPRGYGLMAFCESVDCGHFAPVDLDMLIGRFGPGFDIVDGDAAIRAVLRCARCDGKRISLQLKPPTGRLMF